MDWKPYKRTALYYETDQMGVIHHSNYIRWFEEARIDRINQMGLTYERIETMGIFIPVLEVSCSYKKSVFYNETVEIASNIIEFTGLKFTMEYDIYNRETKEQKAKGISKHCFVDRNWMPIRLKKQFPEIYKLFNESIKID